MTPAFRSRGGEAESATSKWRERKQARLTSGRALDVRVFDHDVGENFCGVEQLEERRAADKLVRGEAAGGVLEREDRVDGVAEARVRDAFGDVSVKRLKVSRGEQVERGSERSGTYGNSCRSRTLFMPSAVQSLTV